jgi:prolyl-tRNA synthetase
VSPLALDENTFPRVVTVLDSALATSSSLFAVHAQSSSETLFLKGTDIAAYLRHLEKEDLKLHEVDFATLAAEGGAAPPAKDKPVAKDKDKEREDAKIEGAVQIAIGVKKEVDFPQWYTNVCVFK